MSTDIKPSHICFLLEKFSIIYLKRRMVLFTNKFPVYIYITISTQNNIIQREQTGSSAMVSRSGFFDLHMDNLCMNSGVENSSISSKFSFGTGAAAVLFSCQSSPALPSTNFGASPDLVMGLTFPPETQCLAVELAVKNKAPMSAAVTTEFTLLMGNMT